MGLCELTTILCSRHRPPAVGKLTSEASATSGRGYSEISPSCYDLPIVFDNILGIARQKIMQVGPTTETAGKQTCRGCKAPYFGFQTKNYELSTKNFLFLPCNRILLISAWLELRCRVITLPGLQPLFTIYHLLLTIYRPFLIN